MNGAINRAGKGTTGIMLALLSITIYSAPSTAQQFGRFFTTPKERKHLQELRQKPRDVSKNAIDDDFVVVEESDDSGDKEAINTVKVKGIVYRSNKGSTAWVNDSNTYEADPEIGFMTIDDKKISQSHVTIRLPGGKHEHKLKPGQSLDPKTEAVYDIHSNTPGGISETTQAENQKD